MNQNCGFVIIKKYFINVEQKWASHLQVVKLNKKYISIYHLSNWEKYDFLGKTKLFSFEKEWGQGVNVGKSKVCLPAFHAQPSGQ